MALVSFTPIASQYAKAVSSVALTLVDLGFTAAQVAAADRAMISIETASLRYTFDGTAPTSANGHLAPSATMFVLDGHELISRIKLIRATVSDASVHVTLLKW